MTFNLMKKLELPSGFVRVWLQGVALLCGLSLSVPGPLSLESQALAADHVPDLLQAGDETGGGGADAHEPEGARPRRFVRENRGKRPGREKEEGLLSEETFAALNSGKQDRLGEKKPAFARGVQSEPRDVFSQLPVELIEAQLYPRLSVPEVINFAIKSKRCWDRLPAYFRLQSAREWILLTDLKIEDSQWVSYFQHAGPLHDIESLRLSCCRVNLGLLPLLPKTLKSLVVSDLRHTDGTQLNPRDVEALGQALFKLPHLQVLVLRNSVPSQKSLQALKLGRLAQVRTLALQGFRLGGVGHKSVGLASLKQLVILRLVNCDLGCDGGAGLRAFSSASFPCLKKLWLDGNRLGPVGASELHLEKLTCLSELSLGSNPLGAEGIRALRLEQLPSLQALFVDSCQLTQENLAELRAALPACKIITQPRKGR